MSVYRVVSEQSSRVMNVRTVPEMGWAGVQNGELLSLAAATFDVLLTVDSSIEYQQDVPAFEISVMVLRARSNDIAALVPLMPAVVDALSKVGRGRIVEIGE